MKKRAFLAIMLASCNAFSASNDDANDTELLVEALGIDRYMITVQNAANKISPFNLSELVVHMYSVAYGSGLSSAYVVDAEKIPRDKLSSYINATKSKMINKLCGELVTGTLIKKYNAAFKATYANKEGDYIFSQEVNMASCKLVQ